MKKFLGVLVFLIVVGVGAYAYERGVSGGAEAPLPGGERAITLAGARVVVELATTTAERERGLSGRPDLAADRGMLFVFPQDGVYRFWMKDMNFSLDIIWLSPDGTVLYMQPDLAPSTYPNSYGPTTPARYVLEVNAGFAQAHGLRIGDRVTL